MSEKSPSLMIKTILGHLESGLEKLESGQLSPEDMELLVEDAKELYERMVIMRYKIYETNVLGVSAPVVSASIRQPEIETPIDLFGASDLGSEPEFEVTFANEDPIIDEEKVSYPLEEEVEEELGFKNEILEDVIETEKESNFENDSFDKGTEESVIASIFENESSEEDEDEEEEGSFLDQDESSLSEELVEATEFNNSDILEEDEEAQNVEPEPFIEETPIEVPQTNYEPQFSADQPIWMAEMEANIRDNRSIFPLETLAGAFTLNEKLQFINELFDGSSDDFSSSVKQLDQLANMDAARNMLAELSQSFNWDTESEIVEDFLYKICRRHAAGA
ncbi:MAG: hypothetical protein RIT34_1500 [Bacteroidota bacterium]|jgi:hypothetical protein